MLYLDNGVDQRRVCRTFHYARCTLSRTLQVLFAKGSHEPVVDPNQLNHWVKICICLCLCLRYSLVGQFSWWSFVALHC
jgi:hypothetical protein